MGSRGRQTKKLEKRNRKDPDAEQEPNTEKVGQKKSQGRAESSFA